MERFVVVEYYLKGLHPFVQQDVFRLLKDEFSSIDLQYVETAAANFENWKEYQNPFAICHNVDDVKRMYELIASDLTKVITEINKIMSDNGYDLLFPDPTDLLACFKWRNILVSFLPEDECNKIIGCSSYEEYEPWEHKKHQ